MQCISLPQLVWDETGPFEILLPESWQVDMCRMAGYDRPILSSAAMAEAIAHPIVAPPISTGAREKEDICIIFDDMSRPTRVAAIVPHVLEELHKAGVNDDQVRFVCALGAHGALTRRDFVKKLGEEVVARFPVFNHNVIGNCTFVGTTSTGIDLHINSEVVRCHYKIGIGSVVPHAFAGFGGGAKIILPGVASFETIRAMHRMKLQRQGDATIDFDTAGCMEGNRIRHTIEEAAETVGLDFIISAIVNEWGDTVSLFAGSPEAAFRQAVEEAQWHYLTPRPKDCDVVITNTFAKASESEGGTIAGIPSLKREGGDLVLISNAPEGHVCHYLLGVWGTVSPGELRLVVRLPPQVERLIIFSQYRDVTAKSFYAPSDKVLLFDDWGEVLRALEARHGERARAAVYTSAEIQHCGE